jgi:hypothetical protein
MSVYTHASHGRVLDRLSGTTVSSYRYYTGSLEAQEVVARTVLVSYELTVYDRILGYPPKAVIL